MCQRARTRCRHHARKRRPGCFGALTIIRRRCAGKFPAENAARCDSAQPASEASKALTRSCLPSMCGWKRHKARCRRRRTDVGRPDVRIGRSSPASCRRQQPRPHLDAKRLFKISRLKPVSGHPGKGDDPVHIRRRGGIDRKFLSLTAQKAQRGLNARYRHVSPVPRPVPPQPGGPPRRPAARPQW